MFRWIIHKCIIHATDDDNPVVIWPHEAAIEHFDEQLLGVNVDFGAVKVTVGDLAVEKQVSSDQNPGFLLL